MGDVGKMADPDHGLLAGDRQCERDQEKSKRVEKSFHLFFERGTLARVPPEQQIAAYSYITTFPCVSMFDRLSLHSTIVLPSRIARAFGPDLLNDG